jgi:hypothetical protein
MQPHTMLLWAEPIKEEFDELIIKSLNILKILEEYGPEISPVYVRELDKIKKFDLTKEKIKTIFMNNLNKEGDKVFIEAGYNIHFFSHIEEKIMTAIYLHIGVTIPFLTNSIIIKFSNLFSLSNKASELLKRLLYKFNPFWGCISNDINNMRYDKFIKNNKPTAMHWLNFWGSKLLNELNINNWEDAPIEKYEQINDGYFIQLKKEPIDDENENDLILQQNANRYFNL